MDEWDLFGMQTAKEERLRNVRHGHILRGRHEHSGKSFVKLLFTKQRAKFLLNFIFHKII